MRKKWGLTEICRMMSPNMCKRWRHVYSINATRVYVISLARVQFFSGLLVYLLILCLSFCWRNAVYFHISNRGKKLYPTFQKKSHIPHFGKNHIPQVLISSWRNLINFDECCCRFTILIILYKNDIFSNLGIINLYMVTFLHILKSWQNLKVLFCNVITKNVIIFFY